MKKGMLVLVIGLIVSAHAAAYPVNEEIQILRDKADYLEQLRDILEGNRCAVTVDGNKVGLVPGAIRSEALVMGITSTNPGNYYAYHKAPKPQFLHNVVGARDARIVVATLLYPENSKEPSTLLVKIAEPFLVQGTSPGLWIYNKTYLRLPVPAKGEKLSAEGVTQTSAKVEVVCNP